MCTLLPPGQTFMSKSLSSAALIQKHWPEVSSQKFTVSLDGCCIYFKGLKWKQISKFLLSCHFKQCALDRVHREGGVEVLPPLQSCFVLCVLMLWFSRMAQLLVYHCNFLPYLASFLYQTQRTGLTNTVKKLVLFLEGRRQSRLLFIKLYGSKWIFFRLLLIFNFNLFFLFALSQLFDIENRNH